MTFGNFILSLRERLNDMRKSDTSAITLITEDGIRWTSSKLIEIANSSIAQAYRLLTIYSKNPVVEQLTPLIGSIAYVGVTITSGVGDMPTNGMYIVELIDTASSSNNSYAYIAPDKYLLYRGMGKQPISEGFFFTILWDSTNSVRKIYTLPATSFTAAATYILSKINYANTDGAVVLSLTNMDDFLLDIAEREARDREHNWERSKILDARIAIKLGINLGG
jgi:hypothetical protein